MTVRRLHRVTVLAGTAALLAGLLEGGTSAHAASRPLAGRSAGSSVRSTGPDIGHLSEVQARQLGAGADRSVVVVFKDQVAGLPATRADSRARASAVGRIQAPVVRELSELHAPAVKTLSLINAVSAEVSPAEESRLAADPAVAKIVPNSTMHLSFPATGRNVVARAVKSGSVSTTSSAACQPGAKGVELDPEALSVIHANGDLPGSGPTAASLGITGAGVTVAYLAEGFNVNNPDFIRPDGKHVFVDYKDFTGEGSAAPVSGGEAELDASSIADQGRQTYEIQLPSGGTCDFRVVGAAPGASIVGLKVFPNDYDATTTSLLMGINYAVSTDHVNVLNESFGYNPLPDTTTDVIRMADEAAVKAGTVVDVSSGDAGPTSTVGSPSTDPAVLSAGATTTYRTYAQADIENYVGFNAKGWEDDNLSGLSSGGFPQDLKGPNLVAPGDLNWVSCNPAPKVFAACISGGTSEAAPLTSATAALVIQAYRKTHGGATPTPALVKTIITSTATDLGLPGDEQGSGLLDSYRAVLAAESVKTPAGAPTPVGQTLATSVDRIDATAPAGSTVSQKVAVTNNGTGSETLNVHGRMLSTPTTVLSSKFSEAGSNWEKKYTFTVAPGTSHLDADAATLNPSSAFIDVTLLDPQGRLAIDGLPQGYTSSSNVGVRYPEAGKWTAYVTDGGPSGNAPQPSQFVVTTTDWKSFGTVQPSKLTLAPGATGSVSVSVPMPVAGGEESAAVELDSSGAAPVSIPVALRSLVPITGGSGHFTSSVIGGNGRGGAPSATQYFSFDVPSGQPELNVATAFANGPSSSYSTYLVSPSGEALGHASNQLVIGGTAAAPVTTTEPGTESHVLTPAGGRWTLIVAFSNPSSEIRVAAPLTGTIDFAPVVTSVSGLPTSTGSDIAVGSSQTVAVTVTNKTDVPESYFLDPRLNTEVTKTLEPLASAKGIDLPLPYGPIPQWIVPTDTTHLVGKATATAPVTFDMSPYLGNFGGELNGDPQIGATSAGDTATASWSDYPITPGVWNIDPGLVGVFKAPAAKATVDLALSATTAGFNSAFTTTYGDLWDGKGNVHPVTVSPGQTVTLYAALDPATAGTKAGNLYLDTASSINPYGNAVVTGDQAAAIPYSYTATGS